MPNEPFPALPTTDNEELTRENCRLENAATAHSAEAAGYKAERDALLDILRDYPKGQDDGTWRRRRDTAIGEPCTLAGVPTAPSLAVLGNCHECDMEIDAGNLHIHRNHDNNVPSADVATPPPRVNEPRPAPPEGKPAAWVNGWRCATGYGGGGMPPLGNAAGRTLRLYHEGYEAGNAATVAWLARGNTLRQP